MQNFCKLREQQKASKADVRQAQLSFIKCGTTPGSASADNRQLGLDTLACASKPAASYPHPCYRVPFILTGYWL